MLYLKIHVKKKKFRRMKCFGISSDGVFVFFSFYWILRFGAVACGVASELYVFGGVRSRDDSQASEMVTCKSEFYHDEFKR